MLVDNFFAFATNQALTGTSDTLSTNVFDAGTAKRLFQGVSGMNIQVTATAAGGTTPTFRARFVGADDAGLTTNPEIIDDTGLTKAIVAADLPLEFVLKPSLQKVAKRYYGVIFTQGGTSPTATASANGVVTPQTHNLQP